MDDLYGKRILVIAGKEQVYDNIDDLGEEIEMYHSELRVSHTLLTDNVDRPTIEHVYNMFKAQGDRIEAYAAWLKEQEIAEAAAIAELRNALRELPISPFEGE